MVDDPRIPHIVGILLDSNGVANTQVIILNKSSRDNIIIRVDANKVGIFDIADFTTAYEAGDVIEFINVGASVGQGTLTISDATGGFQEITLVCAAAPTVSVDL